MIDGVSVTLSSGAATTTSGGGYFSFLDVEGGTYTITITGLPADASFDATTAEVTIAQADQTVTTNFSGSWIRTASLMGMVTVEGMGLPGITVSISGRQEAQMVTDDNGQYTFTGLRAGNYTVEISGFDATDVAFSATSSAVTVSAGESKVWSFDGTFVRESAVSGQVSVEGNGLSGVTVSLQGMGADEEAMTDAGGQYTFSNLRAGDYQLAISGYDTDEYGFSTTSATVRVEHGRTANVPFEGILLRTASIMGQVSVEGEGLADVTVSLSGEGENQTTMTDNSGQYAFTELPAGNFQVGISGYDTGDYSFETTSKNVAVALGGTATVPFDGILLRTSGIAGRVSVDGMGLEDVTVTLSGGDLEEDVTAMTDATGQYAIAGLAAGDYTVAISGYDAVEYAFEDSQDVTLAKDATAIVNFAGKKLRTAAVSVMVTADGEGVAGVRADLIQITNLATQAGSVIASGATGADGGHMFGDLLAGAYGVQISGADEEIDFATTLMVVMVATDETGEATFAGAINRTASIGGMVTVDGAGMAGVMVALSGGDDNVDLSMATGDDGSYSFSDLRRGDYTVSITNPDADMYNFASTSSDVSVGVGQAQGDVSFAGSQVRTSSISGQVNVEGEALGDVTVTLSGAMEAEQTTGDDGLYAFRNLGSGSYTVSIANPDDAAYSFESMSMDFDLGNSDNQTHNFSGTHTRDGSISGMLFVDEGTENNMQDEGEYALMAAGVEVVLVGPTLLNRTSAMTDDTGAFAFGDLRQGSYQVMPAAPGAAVMDDFMYGGDASYAVELGVAEDATQNLPYDITHQTVNFAVSLKSGEDMGDALPGATVSFFSDLAGAQKIGDATSDADGMASLRFARSAGNTVYASVAAPEGDYHTSGAMQAVTWDAKYRMTDASNEADIVNTKADFSFSGATITTSMGGGKPLAGWQVSVASDKSAAEDAPDELGADGSAKYSEVVMADSLPVTYTVKIAANQDNSLDGGSKYDAGDGLEHTHDGLSLPATMNAGQMEVEYTTQTLRVYIHEENDQVAGYTGNILGGDVRMSGKLDIGIRHIERSTGRSRAFPSSPAAVRVGKSDRGGVVTFTNVPASAQVIVQASPVADENIKLLGEDELDAYTGHDDNGMMGGAFGDEGGFHHTVELCPLMSDEGNQRHGECGTFAFVNTHHVYGQVWENSVRTDAAGGFRAVAISVVRGVTVAMDPVDGENLAGDSDSYTSGTNNPRTPFNEALNFDWGRKAAGEYKVTVPSGWIAKRGTPAEATNDLAGYHSPLEGDLQIDVSPTTGYVYGIVEDGSGFRVEGATVTVNGVSGATDSFGRYRIRGFGPRTVSRVPNRVVITVAMEGFQNGTANIAFAANAPGQQDFTLQGTTKTATVAGTVRAGGDPVAGAEIKVNGSAPLNAATSGANRGKLLTDSDGAYSALVDASSGTAVITVERRGMSFAPASHTVTVSDGLSISGLDFSGFDYATISGRVLNENGGPMAGVTVTATPAGGGDAADEDETDVRGVYSLSVPFGRYTVAASLAGYSFGDDEEVNVSPGESKSLDDFDATRVAGSDATLSALSLSDGTLDPAFAADVEAYTASVDNNVASVTVTGTATDANASVAITLAGDTAGTDQSNGRAVELGVGETAITAMVVSEDESDTTSYVVTVTRAQAVVTLSAPASVLEGGEATITATVDHPQDSAFTVTVSADGFGSVTSTSADLTFDAGATSSTGEVTVTATNNAAINDSTETAITVSGSTTNTDVADIDDVEIAVEDDESVPTAPRDLDVTLDATTDGSATVTWSHPANAGSAPITSFVWATSADGNVAKPSGTVDLSTDPSTALSAALTGLALGVEYTFSVHAVSTMGDGATATETFEAMPGITMTLSGTTLNEDQSDTITVTIALTTASEKDVTITVASSDTDAATVANGTVTITAGSTTPAATDDAPTIVAVQNDADDNGGTDAVTFDVSASSDDARDPDDQTVTITDDDVIPGQPGTLVFSGVSTTGFTVEWTSPSAPGTSAITSYEIRYSSDTLDDDDEWTTVSGGGGARTHAITGLTAGTTYNVEVRAVSAAGDGTARTGSQATDAS